MNIRINQALFLAGVVLLCSLAAAVWFMDRAHDREAAQMLTSITQERTEMRDRLLELNGQSLQNFSTDYSAWTEMANFLKTGDKQWAAVNIDASLVTFGAHAAWVLQLDGTTHYSANRLPNGSLQDFALNSAAFLAKLNERRMLHFFQRSPAGILEVRTAPIQLSEDASRVTPPLGWLVVARLWDDAYIQQLAHPLQSTASWRPRTATDDPEQLNVQLRQDLRDWNGQLVASLYLNYHPTLLAEVLNSNYRETYVLCAFGLTIFVLGTASTALWIIRPLRRLSQALEFGRPELISGLAQKKTEFGNLAKLVELLVVQRDALQHEVLARAKLERTLRETETDLQHSLELRSRLARDLHDDIIQRIYAAGLGLEGIRSVLHSEPALADQRLSASQKALNESIAEVRGFIATLEPTQVSRQPFLFSQALTSLASNLEVFQHSKVTVAVDESVARRLNPEQEVQILKIARESISNALRHADADSIHLSLQPHGTSDAVLIIADDGKGFDPAQRSLTGRGLANLTERGRELGGTLLINSTPGKGTRVTLYFKPAFPLQA